MMPRLRLLTDSRLQGLKHRRLPAVLVVSYFFAMLMFISAIYTLLKGFSLSPLNITLKLLPGVLLGVGAFIPDNMLSRSGWSSIRAGLILSLFASICLMVWGGGDSSVVTIAATCAGFGFSAVHLGVSSERAALPLAELPQIFDLALLRAKLIGAAGGLVCSALFGMAQRGGFHVSLLRMEFAIPIIPLAVCCGVFSNVGGIGALLGVSPRGFTRKRDTE